MSGVDLCRLLSEPSLNQLLDPPERRVTSPLRALGLTLDRDGVVRSARSGLAVSAALTLDLARVRLAHKFSLPWGGRGAPNY